MGGEKCLQHKGEVIGKMVSTFQNNCRGFWFCMTKEELDLVNEHEIQQGKPLLVISLGLWLMANKEQLEQWDGGGLAHHRNHQLLGQDEPFLWREAGR